jgi:hypothetical protein
MARIIRWIGHPSPMDDHNIRRRIASGSLSPDLVLAFENFEHNRRVSVNRGRSTFVVGPEQGMSKPYRWGPQHFDVEMEEKDWARLASNAIDRYMMMDVTNGVPQFKPLLTAAQWRELLDSVSKTPQPRTAILM